MSEKYKFEEVITDNMQFPSNEIGIQVSNIAYTAMAVTLEKHLPGFSKDLLELLDQGYAQNAREPAGVAIAQIARRVQFAIDHTKKNS